MNPCKPLLLGMIASCIITLAPSTVEAQFESEQYLTNARMLGYMEAKEEYLNAYTSYKKYRGHMTGNPTLAKSYWTKTLAAYQNLEQRIQDLRWNPRLKWFPSLDLPKQVSRFEWQPEKEAYQRHISAESIYEWGYFRYIHNSYNMPNRAYEFWVDLACNKFPNAWYAAEAYNADYGSYLKVNSTYYPNWHEIPVWTW